MWKSGRRLTLHVGFDVLDALQLTRNALLCAAYLFVGISGEGSLQTRRFRSCAFVVHTCRSIRMRGAT